MRPFKHRLGILLFNFSFSYCIGLSTCDMAVPNALVIVILSLPRWYKSLFTDLVKSGNCVLLLDCFVAACCQMLVGVDKFV